MNTYWTSNTGSAESFWEHEWGKHGTCISTLNPNCYTDYQPTEEVPDFFERTVDLFKSLPSYDWLKQAGIEPSTSKTYALSDIQSALSKHHGGEDVYVGCSNDGALEELWYFFNVRGSLQTGDFVPSEVVGVESTCPDQDIKYLPKSGGSSPTSSAPSGSSTAPSSSTSSSGASPTGAPFSGKGYLNVITSGSKKGCIISGGTWYTSGTCATFTATTSGDGLTLKSSKGDCGVSDGELKCGSDVGSSSTFSADGTLLKSEDGSTWYADSVPSGSEQGSVYASGNGHATELEIQWQAI